MKTPTVFSAVAAIAVFATSIGLSAQAQSDPQNHSAQALAPTASPAPATPPAEVGPAGQPPTAIAGAPAGEVKLTAEESEKAVALIQDKCTRCHGIEPIVDQHLNHEGWKGVLDNMGPSADLSKDETALALRYLVENLGPAPAKT